MYSIGILEKKFNLSRSILLYYDRIDLLKKPTNRSLSDHREYSESDYKCLEQICLYRKTGLSLKDIKKILSIPKNKTMHILEKRLEDLFNEIKHLRNQQRVIVNMLKNDNVLSHTRIISKNNGQMCSDLQAWMKKQ